MTERTTVLAIRQWIAPWGLSLGAHAALLLLIAPQFIAPPDNISDATSIENLPTSFQLVQLRERLNRADISVQNELGQVVQAKPGSAVTSTRSTQQQHKENMGTLSSQALLSHPIDAQEGREMLALDSEKAQKSKPKNNVNPIQQTKPKEEEVHTQWTPFIAAPSLDSATVNGPTKYISARNVSLNPTSIAITTKHARAATRNVPEQPSARMQKQSLTASDVGINEDQTPVKPPLNLPETDHASDTIHEPSLGAFEQFEAYAHSQAAQSGRWSPRVARLTPAMAGSETKHEVHSPALQGIKQPRRQKSQRKNRAPDTPSKRHAATTSAKASDAHVAPNASTPLESIQELQEVFTQSKRQQQQTFSIVRISNHGTEDSIIASRSHEGVYRSLIDEIISENWLAMPLDGPESIHIHGATVIEFKIRRTGRVANIELTKTSGHSILDIVALNSIPKRLPRLPREVGKKMRHQYTFRYINPSLEK